jgi:hypothetical protein
MKTDDLVDMLAQGDVAVDARAPTQRALAAFGLALVASLLLMAFRLGVLPVLADYAQRPMFWLKAAFGVSVAVAAFVLVRRLARPGARLGRVGAAVVAPFVAMWLLAAIVLLRADPQRRGELMLGETWSSCPTNIAILSAPVFVASLWALRDWAPTRLRLAGAAAGLAAGATGAAVYTLHCPELAAPFLGIWYALGMLIPTVLGALVGPRVLRW